MPLPTGSRLGPYEVLAPLGAGGMGEVYRARDTRLGREVAVKVLPTEFAADTARRTRFEQEARAASALNHPGIVTVHDIGEADGALFVAMELVEGRTLREQLADGPLATKRTLDLAVQVADGLAKAHAAGIVHRDLKPENLMLSKDGFIKILDFGLAKVAAAQSAPEVSHLPTLARHESTPGTVLGTVGYMSPEQASGQAVDYRSDQFSLGAILYEAATAKRAFQGKNSMETLAAILRDEPEPLAPQNPRLPAPFRWIVERCLAKDPEDRYQSTRDLARELRSVRDHLSETTTSSESPSPAPRRRAAPRALLVGLGLLATLAAGILIGARINPTRPAVYQPLTFQRGTVWSARFAPDGQTIVYGASWAGRPAELFTTRLENPESRSLGLMNADLLAVSSKGEMAVLLNRRYLGQFLSIGTLARVPIAGGTPRQVIEDVVQAEWSSDGTSLAVVRRVGGFHQLEFPIGNVLYKTTGYVSDLRISSRGDLLAFMDHQYTYDDRGWLVVVDRAGHKKLRTEEWSAEEGLAWTPAADEIWFAASRSGEVAAIYGVSLSGRERVVARNAADLRLLDVSHWGQALLTSGGESVAIRGLGPGATRERDLSHFQLEVSTDIARDGNSFIGFHWGEGGGLNYTTYLHKMDSSAPVRLGEGNALSLSPDGKWAMASLFSPPELRLWPTAAGDARRISQPGMEQYDNAVWLPDSQHIVVSAREAGHQDRCYVQSLEDGKPRTVTPEGVSCGSGASDGHSVLGRTDATGALAFYPLDGSQPRPVVGAGEADRVAGIAEDGRSLYVYHWHELPVRIERLDPATGRRVLFRETEGADASGFRSVGGFSITPNGAYYVYSIRRALSQLFCVSGLR